MPWGLLAWEPHCSRKEWKVTDDSGERGGGESVCLSRLWVPPLPISRPPTGSMLEEDSRTEESQPTRFQKVITGSVDGGRGRSGAVPQGPAASGRHCFPCGVGTKILAVGEGCSVDEGPAQLRDIHWPLMKGQSSHTGARWARLPQAPWSALNGGPQKMYIHPTVWSL